MILLFIPRDFTISCQLLGGFFMELHSVILNVVISSARSREELSSANHPVYQKLIWRCVSPYERPKGRASAKNLRESAIGVRKTLDLVTPASFP